MTNRYAVTGNPVDHSKSPQIHAAFASQTGENLSYTKLLLPVDGFKEGAEDFFAQGGKGLNVTVPFKLQAWELSALRSQRAERAGAVNTLLQDRDGKIIGDTTDGTGLVRDLCDNYKIQIESKTLLILGAGGAVRGVLSELLEKKPRRIIIANRTVKKAKLLAEQFSDIGCLYGCGFDELAGQQTDLIINGTSASLQGELPALPDDLIHENSICYDMMYSAHETVFNRWARERGAAITLDGLGMLVEQAAESFFIWRGVRPQTTPVIEQLRSELT